MTSPASPKRRQRALRTLVIAVVLAGLARAASAQSSALTTLYQFSGSDGANPAAGLVQGSDGNFYGTTELGGSPNMGTVFRLTPAGALTTLVAFAGTNGAEPSASLLQGAGGNFYGTNYTGTTNEGTAFQVTPAGTLTTLVTFTRTNGSGVAGGLIQGSDGNFYGTTAYGGANDDGTVFKLTPSGVLTTLVSFNGANGINPEASLVQGSDGDFYGTTEYGGSSSGDGSLGYGTVFQVTPAGTLTTLVNFTQDNGANPQAELIQASNGNFYGTTQGAGAGGNGTVFEVTPTGTLTTLASFNLANGGAPLAALVQASDGNFYGTTSQGGDGANIGNGTVFQLTPSGSLTTLAAFNFANGSYPEGKLIQGSDGYLYGTTGNGGNTTGNPMGYGTIFRIAIPVSAHPSFFAGEAALGSGVYYLAFPNGNVFGYYNYEYYPYLYHYDLGFEYVIDANDGRGGLFLYDFASGHFWYTSPVFPFPYLYDFGLGAFLYDIPDSNNPGHYTTNPRYFSNLTTGQIITQ